MSLHLPDAPLPRHAASRPAGALHHGVFAVDVIGFGRRPAAVYPHLRTALYRIVDDAFGAIGLPLESCHHEDRGDGILVIAPTHASVELLLGPLTARLQAGLRGHNRLSSPQAQLRLRTAVNAGYVRQDRHGISGRTLNDLYRLLDAPAYRRLMDAHNADLGLITSDRVHQDLIEDNPDLVGPGAFLPTPITAKETATTAWIWLPPLVPASRPDDIRSRDPLPITPGTPDLHDLSTDTAQNG